MVDDMVGASCGSNAKEQAMAAGTAAPLVVSAEFTWVRHVTSSAVSSILS